MSDESVDPTLTTFSSKSADSWCDRTNVWFVKNEKSGPTQDIHVLTGGLNNEFCITQQCSRDDYAFVLKQLLRYNK